MFDINEDNFKKFLYRWLDGIGSEVGFWEWAMSNDYWNYYVGNKIEQSKIEHSSDAKKILDVGSGPITVLNPNKDVIIYACDPLAEYYRFLLNKYNKTPIVETEFCLSERLYEKYKANFFDEVHMQNALDHSFLPMNSIFNFLHVVKISGKIILKHHRNEAQFEKYLGLHQFNVDVENNNAILWNKDIKININDIIGDIGEITCEISQIQREGKEQDFITIEIIKKKDFNILEYVSNNYYFDKYLFLVSTALTSDIYLDKYDDILYGRLKRAIKFTNKRNKFVKKFGWYIPIRKLRDKFREKYYI